MSGNKMKGEAISRAGKGAESLKVRDFPLPFPSESLSLWIAANYGSGGWGFKSLLARHIFTREQGPNQRFVTQGPEKSCTGQRGYNCRRDSFHRRVIERFCGFAP